MPEYYRPVTQTLHHNVPDMTKDPFVVVLSSIRSSRNICAGSMSKSVAFPVTL